MRQPVAHDEAVKTHPVFQHIGQQALIGVHLDAMPRIVTRHDRLGAGIDGVDIGRAMQAGEIGFGDRGFALVAAAIGRAVAEEVLGGGDDMMVVEKGLT